MADDTIAVITIYSPTGKECTCEESQLEQMLKGGYTRKPMSKAEMAAAEKAAADKADKELALNNAADAVDLAAKAVESASNAAEKKAAETELSKANKAFEELTK